MIGQGAGAVAGDLALYGPVGWAVGGALVGATNAALSGETGIGILKGGGIGAASSLVGGYAGQFAASSLGAVTVNGFRITSPVIKGTVGGLAGGAGGGYASGFTVGYLTTGDLEQANEMGLSGMKSGAIMGTLSGAGAGYKYAKDYNLDWKTGTPIYPSNNGAVLGSTTNEYLMPNTKIDRYGGDQGYFFSEPGTPISSRSLPPNNSGVYNQYEVLKPIPVQKSIITPWFGQPGGGVQYQTPVPVRVLIDKGFIIKY
ncbi:TNT domain-containing protein [Dysgonomonas sp. GY617]|nr:TNT domain-containing protein [Dysgonomonas sp. GY617]